MNIRLMRRPKIKYQELLLNCSVLLLSVNYLMYSFFSNDQYKDVLRILVVPVLALAIVQRHKFTSKHLLVLAAAAYSLIMGGTMALNIAFILAVSVVSVTLCKSEKEYVRILNKVQTVLFGVVVASLLIGVVTPQVTTVGGRTRSDLGFMNINSAAIFFSATLLLYCMYAEKLTWHKILILFLLSVLLWQVTDSRTSFIGLLLYFVMLLFFKWTVKKKRLQKICLTVGALLVLCSPLIWHLGTLNNLMFNQLLSMRPQLFSNYCAKSSELSLLLGGSKAGEIDNAWLMLLYNVGLPLYIAFAAITLRALWRLADVGEYRSVAFLIMMLAVGMMESLPLRAEILTANLFWYILAKYGLPKSRRRGKNSFAGLNVLASKRNADLAMRNKKTVLPGEANE